MINPTNILKSSFKNQELSKIANLKQDRVVEQLQQRVEMAFQQLSPEAENVDPA